MLLRRVTCCVLVCALLLPDILPPVSKLFHLYASTSSGGYVRFGIKPDYLPPLPITDIVAAPGFDYSPRKAGVVKLVWTAPEDDSTYNSGIFSYVVRYATFSIASLAVSTSAADYQEAIEAWWSHPQVLTALSRLPPHWGIPAVSKPHEREVIYLITGLEPGEFYWFSVKTRDRICNLSNIDLPSESVVHQSSAYATTGPMAPLKITTIFAEEGDYVDSVKLIWEAPGNDYEVVGDGFIRKGKIIDGAYRIRYSTVNPDIGGWQSYYEVYIATKNVNPYELQVVHILDLPFYTTWYFAIWAKDEWPDNWSGESYHAASYPYFKPSPPLPVTELYVVAGASTNPSVGSYLTLHWKNPPSHSFRGVRIIVSTSTFITSPTDYVHIVTDIYDLPKNAYASYQHEKLLPRTTYYYTVFALSCDKAKANFYFSTGTIASGFTYLDFLPPTPITSITLEDFASTKDQTYIDVSWVTPDDPDIAGVRIVYTTYTYASYPHEFATFREVPVLHHNTTATYRLDNLIPWTTYYITVFTYDWGKNYYDPGWGRNYSLLSSTGMRYTRFDALPPSMVKNFKYRCKVDDYLGAVVELSWENPPEGDLSKIYIYRSTVTYPVATQLYPGDIYYEISSPKPRLLARFLDNNYNEGLEPWTTYYYSVYVVDITELYSEAVSTKVVNIPPLDLDTPNAAAGLQLVRDTTTASVIVSWKPVCKHTNDKLFSSISRPKVHELWRYYIYSAPTLYGPWKFVARTKPDKTTYTIPPTDKVMYYKIVSRDYCGNWSESMIFDTSDELNLYSVSLLGNYVRLPKALHSLLLLKENNNNKYNDDLIIAIKDRVEQHNKKVVESIEVIPYTAGSVPSSPPKKPIYESVKFSEPGAELVFHYKVEGNKVVYISSVTSLFAAPALMTSAELPTPSYNYTVNLTDVAAESAELNLMVLWYNGLEWIKLGGKVDKSKQTVSVKIYYTGKYQLRHVLRATTLTLSRVLPRIFTPNNDGYNDKVFFYLEDPNLADIKFKVLDVSGAEVSTKVDIVSRENEFTILSWDGTDNSGAPVPPGVYIYQIEAEGKVINGTVIIAR